MMQYFSGPTKDLAILSPASKDGFKIKQTTIGELSSSANLEGKFYKGLMPAWPGNHCLLYTSDAADDLLCVDLGGRRIIKKNFLLKN